MEIDLTRLKEALAFREDGFTPWNEEKELFIAAARAYLSLMETQPVLESGWETVADKHFDGKRWLVGNPAWSNNDAPEIGFWNGNVWDCGDITYDHDEVTHCHALPSMTLIEDGAAK